MTGSYRSSEEAEDAFREAQALLADPASPDAFRRGAALLETAAGAGHAGALLGVATMAALGAGRRRDWPGAFDRLARAAQAGSEGARGQIELLSRGAGATGSAIDLPRLLAAPRPEALSEEPRLRVFRGLATAAECAWIVDRLGDALGPAMVWDEATGMGKPDPVRSNSALELLLPRMDVVLAVVRARIAAATGLPETIFEVPQLMRYRPGEEFKPHHDGLDPGQPGTAADLRRRGQRIGTFLLYLNDQYEGGETDFPAAALSFRGGTGDALFFANVTRDGTLDPLSLHAGRPPTSGEKWILSQWIRDRPPSS
jgi:prolyl 4-hydroxylase